ncbi:hypothetical protein NBRC111894_4325 [Sporolactobacillus inulinus]|uniref:Uncharacterized protein n=1 Tax=Sporolactobacillus inulinus TaxID=2078 RepID=A0A4Y1ZIH2_9BACL|nr:hypothetical protein [Sporolactobacillus inulinus]GAY78771.1 hypothetical protein NBRC111894_4325 [Sporolactobacillus inulinus]
MSNIKGELVDFNNYTNYQDLDLFLAELFGVLSGLGGYKLSKENLNKVKEEVDKVITLREEGMLDEKLQKDSAYLTRIELHIRKLWCNIHDLQAKYNKSEKNIKYFPVSIMDSYSLFDMRRMVLMDLTNSFELVEKFLK